MAWVASLDQSEAFDTLSKSCFEVPIQSNAAVKTKINKVLVRDPMRLDAVEGLDLAASQLLEDCEVYVVLAHADGNSVKLVVECGRVEVCCLELLHPRHVGLLHKRVVV